MSALDEVELEGMYGIGSVVLYLNWCENGRDSEKKCVDNNRPTRPIHLGSMRFVDNLVWLN